MAQDLRSRFLAAVPDRDRSAWTERADLEARLADLVGRGKAEVGDIGVTDGDLVAFVGRHVEADDALDQKPAGDLLLACGCAHRDPKAVAEFEVRYGADLDRAAAKARSAGLRPDELRQMVVDRLLVGPTDGAPRIAGYAGRGPLRAWVRIAAMRVVVDHLRREGARPEEPMAPEDLLRLPEGAVAPELQLVQQRYREPLRQALESAFEALTPRQRNLLRSQILRGFSTDQLGALYGVHRTTAARWIDGARKQLLDAAKIAMRDLAGVDEREFDSVVAVVRSGLDLSVRRILASRTEAEP